MNGKKNLYILAAMFFVALLTMPAVSADEHADNEDTVKAAEATSKGYIAIGAALAVGLAGIGTGLAQSNIGSAAIGAVVPGGPITTLAVQQPDPVPSLCTWQKGESLW